MKFVSTRNPKNQSTFQNAILDCIPYDGGLFVPLESPDLRRWILYTNENTTFQNIAGTLTSACIAEEFSPIICEAIATNAFTKNSFNAGPEISRLDENLFLLDLSVGPTGSHKDFGIAYLASALESILCLLDGRAIFLDASLGESGASLANALRGKKRIKAILLYPPKSARGILQSDFIWNGGNIFAAEVEGGKDACLNLVREIFSDHDFIKKNFITSANTANIGRLLPQMFFYPFAFSRLKKNANGAIFYAMESGNFSNVVSALYAWQLALPMGGIICPATSAFSLNPKGDCQIIDEIVPVKNRLACDIANPSNLERLENVFAENAFMLKNLVFLADVTESEETAACQELFVRYKIFADRHTSRAYAAAKKRYELADDDVTVLVNRDHPSLSAGWILQKIGEKPFVPQRILNSIKQTHLHKKINTTQELKRLIENL